MQRHASLALALAGGCCVWLASFEAAAHNASLKPSSDSLNRQIRKAAEHDFTYLRNPAHLEVFVTKGWLVRVRPSADLKLSSVSFPYARPEVRLFLQRLSRQYRNACGEKLTVTSLTRPKTHRPRNGSPKGVHPTGMAMDLRMPRRSRCRRWLEKTLLYLEDQHVLEAARERWPPHYHVVLFPKDYQAYVDRRAGGGGAGRHRVSSGDSLWEVARRYGTTVDRLKRMNNLRSSKIRPGQVLRVPDDR